MRFLLPLVVLMLAALPGCIRYAEIPTPRGTFRYLNVGFATEIGDLTVKAPDGFEGSLKGVKSDSAKAVDALAEFAKTAAK